MSSELKKKIDAKKAVVAVIGLGYVGLPLAVLFAKAGFKVYGLDKDADRVKKINHQESYILDVSSHDLAAIVRKKNLEASTSFEKLRTADVIVICVPTPLKTKYTPDISYLLQAVRTIAGFIKRGALIVLESTTYPGTCEELVLPELKKKGFRLDEDFYLAFSPERIDPGNKRFELKKIPKIVGGLTPMGTRLTESLYKKILPEVHTVSSAKVAEMTKLLENSFRIVNIGWINEMAMMCHRMGIDIWEVIEAAKTKPFGFMPFYPGLGVGGHCIPEDPLYLYWKAKRYGFNSKFIKLAADINSEMPSYAVDRLFRFLAKNGKQLAFAKILVMGVTYKKDVKDLRKSPSLRLIELFQERKCKVDYFDPLIPYLKIGKINLKAVSLTKENIAQYECIVIAMDHTRVDYPFVLKHARLIFDTRNVYKNINNPKIVKL